MFVEAEHCVDEGPAIAGTRLDEHTEEPERSTELDMARSEESLTARDA